MQYNNALFVLGGPGSGKDFILRTALKESQAIEIPHSKLVKAITDRVDLAEVNGGPIIISGDAIHGANVALSKAVLESMGYTTALVHVYTTDEISRSRSALSEQKRVIKYLASVQHMYEYKDLFGEGFFLFDNSADFTNVNEDTQNQIISWLKELTESIEKYYKKTIQKTSPAPAPKEPHSVPAGYERVKDGSFYKLRKIKEETLDDLFEKTYPTIVDMIAQKKGKREGNKYEGGIAVPGNKATSREVVETNQEVTVPQTQKKGIKYYKNRPAKGAKPPGDTFDSRMGAVPSGGIGLTAYKENKED